jgi:hypothetical protein
MAAAAFAMAAPTSPITPDDYPRSALAQGRSAATLIELLIDPTGKVARCSNVQTFGDAALAAQICPIALRKRWQPAKGKAAAPVHALVRTLVTFYQPDEPDGPAIAALKQAPDAGFTVSRLPAGADKAEAKVILLVGDQGQIDDCAPDPQESSAALADAVCRFRGQLPVQKQVDANGQLIAYVTAQRVSLAVAAAGQ